MKDARIVAGMAAEDVAGLEHATRLRIADGPDWSPRDHDQVIAYLRAKAAHRTLPKIPPNRA